ncbi:serine hydrolase, partial [Leucobacter sp. M11]|uniref:serine hydrolase n=1 Tax=Leucobacter sp. M11 TaxID=2993565 RepID=UPI002D807D53
MSADWSLPALDPRITWSIRVLDEATAEPLLEHSPDTQCETASIGKVFLLIEVARRIADGTIDPEEIVPIPEEFAVADSGILYRMRDQRLCAWDLALLVGAFSDNLATNALLHRCGLEAVRAVAPELGYTRTSLHDYIRDERTPEMPWTPSYGTARELADVFLRLSRGEIVSPEVSARVLGWLASDADTSMVADAFVLDPLAHVDPEYQGIVLRHKTGTTSFARIDVGTVTGAAGSVAYAVAANWRNVPGDLRVPAMDAMREIGEQIRQRV